MKEKSKSALLAEIQALKSQLKTLETKHAEVVLSAVAALPVSFFVSDMDGKIVYANPAAMVMAGSDNRDLRDRDLRTHLVDSGKTEEILRQTRERGRYSGEYMTRGLDGREFWVRSENAVIRDEAGQETGVVGIVWDITEKRQGEVLKEEYKHRLETEVADRTAQLKTANRQLIGQIQKYMASEKSLRDSEEKYRKVVEGSNDGICISVNGHVKFANQRFAEMLECDPNDVLERTLDDFVSSECQPVMQNMRERFRSGESDRFRFEIVAETQFKRCINLEVTLTRMMCEGTPAALLFVRDVTAQRRMESELLKVHQLESIGKMAGGLANDFNNILTAILGYISIMGNYGKDNPRIAKVTQKAEMVSLQARDLTQQLLTLSHTGPPVKSETSIRDILKGAAGLALRGGKIRCEYDFAEDLWPVLVDGGQVHQAVFNVVANASQASLGSGQVWITAENARVTADMNLPLNSGTYVRVQVKDHGSGISQQHLDRIFDPFFSTKQNSSGLGLVLTHSVVTNHGGWITAASEPGNGTLITLYIPAVETSLHPDPIMARGMLWGSGKILLMDDEESVRDVSDLMLRELGFEGEFAQNGEEAIAKFKAALDANEPFSAVILDLTVPIGMGAQATLPELKRLDPNIKVLLASGYINDSVMTHFAAHGYHGVIRKPFRLEDLSTALAALLAEP